MTKTNIVGNLLALLIKEVRTNNSTVGEKYKLADKYANRINELYISAEFNTPTKEQYKELDELMTYILDEMWGTDDKGLIREAIIAYANKWNEVQNKNTITLDYEQAIKNRIIPKFAAEWNSTDEPLISDDFIYNFLYSE